jgi:hypothetical protein
MFAGYTKSVVSIEGQYFKRTTVCQLTSALGTSVTQISCVIVSQPASSKTAASKTITRAPESNDTLLISRQILCYYMKAMTHYQYQDKFLVFGLTNNFLFKNQIRFLPDIKIRENNYSSPPLMWPLLSAHKIWPHKRCGLW